ncbi:MAG: Pantothenate kinase type III, CoaX-like, partial [uncultured Thermomicrobiales bacterium]
GGAARHRAAGGRARRDRGGALGGGQPAGGRPRPAGQHGGGLRPLRRSRDRDRLRHGDQLRRRLRGGSVHRRRDRARSRGGVGRPDRTRGAPLRGRSGAPAEGHRHRHDHQPAGRGGPRPPGDGRRADRPHPGRAGDRRDDHRDRRSGPDRGRRLARDRAPRSPIDAGRIARHLPPGDGAGVDRRASL